MGTSDIDILLELDYSKPIGSDELGVRHGLLVSEILQIAQNDLPTLKQQFTSILHGFTSCFSVNYLIFNSMKQGCQFPSSWANYEVNVYDF